MPTICHGYFYRMKASWVFSKGFKVIFLFQFLGKRRLEVEFLLLKMLVEKEEEETGIGEDEKREKTKRKGTREGKKYNYMKVRS